MARFELIPNLPPFQTEIEENPKSENLDISSLCVFCGFVTPSIEIVCCLKCYSCMIAHLSLTQPEEEMENMTLLPF